MSTWYTVQCNSSTGLILKWVWRNKKCSFCLFVGIQEDDYAKQPMSGLSLCEILWWASFVHFQFKQARQSNSIKMGFFFFFNSEKKNCRQHLFIIWHFDTLVCCLAVSFASVPVTWWLKKNPLCTLPYTCFKILWLNDRSQFFSLLSAEVNDLNSSIAFTRF